MNRFKRLKWQIVLINMGFVTALLIGLLFAIYSYMNRQMEQQSINVLGRVIKEDSQLYEPLDGVHDIAIPYFTVELRSDGRPSFINGQYYSVDSPSQIAAVMKIAMASDKTTGWVQGYSFRFMKVIGPNGIRISFVDCTYENNLKTKLLYSLISLGLAVLGVFSVLSYFFAAWVVRPIEASWNQQKQFVADASHELKTPLTVILANAQLLQQSETGTNDGVEKKWLANIYEEAKSMKGLIQDMLTLARRDTLSREKMQLMPVDLTHVLQECELQFEAVFYQNDRTLQAEIPVQELFVRANADALGQVLRILLDNAIKYSPSDSITRITVKKTASFSQQEAEIIIANEGEPMSAADCKNIFKRFVRLDQARSENGESGYGLGLSIAAQAMEQQHGKIWASSEDGWNCFHVSLPLAKGAAR